MSQIAAGRYAKALYMQASSKNVVEDVMKALRYLRDSTVQVPELKSFFENPLLTFAEQTKVIHGLFKGKLPEVIIVFLDFIAYKRRLNLLVSIADCFEDMYHEEHNEIVMKAVSAYPLDDAFKNQLTQRIAGLTGKKVLGQYSVDKSLIGGMRVWAAGKLYEYSFNNELQDYKRKALQNV